MKHKLGILCILLGTALLCGALSLFLHNRNEAAEAEQAVYAVLPELRAAVPEEPDQQALTSSLKPEEFLTEEDLKMTEVVIGGYAYIGYLSIPSLELDLPVMSDWTYAKLQSAPCRYAGTLRGNNLVLMAHNYDKHFGRLSKLNAGDELYFTDMDGITTAYYVAERDVLDPYSVEEMTAGAYDLTLFTCTFGGKSRVTVFCDRQE